MKRHPLVEENIIRHDRVAAVRGSESYDARHLEIFNYSEQRRLQKELSRAWSLRQTPNAFALDFGCGTGNLTEKLLGLGSFVTAADVSSGMLKLVEEKLPFAMQKGQLSTQLLTGDFPLPFPDGHFGFVATYSVLHHIPDYLAAVRELARLVCKGGVLLIDHEAAAEVYLSPQPLGLRIHRNLHLPALGIPYQLNRLLKRNKSSKSFSESLERKLPEEGDIHIFCDDHIEWMEIKKNLVESGFANPTYKAYLACHERSKFPWRFWSCRPFAVNTGCLVGFKTGNS